MIGKGNSSSRDIVEGASEGTGDTYELRCAAGLCLAARGDSTPFPMGCGPVLCIAPASILSKGDLT